MLRLVQPNTRDRGTVACWRYPAAHLRHRDLAWTGSPRPGPPVRPFGAVIAQLRAYLPG
jgi:hypothetical protein